MEWEGWVVKGQHIGVGLRGQGLEALRRCSSMGISGWAQGRKIGFGVQRVNSKAQVGFQWLFTGQRQDSGTDQSKHIGGQSSGQVSQSKGRMGFRGQV